MTGRDLLTGALWIGVGVGLGAIGYWIFTDPREHENPAGLARGPDGSKRRRKLPIVKGRAGRFEMREGPDVTCAGAMIHDPTGRAWPKRSVLFGPVRRVRSATDPEVEGAGRHYLGNSHRVAVGMVNAPPRSLDGWVYLGEVERVYYTRNGKKYGGVRFQHPFNKPGALATMVKGKGRVRLYRKGRFCRLELPRGSILDSRGFVWP